MRNHGQHHRDFSDRNHVTNTEIISTLLFAVQSKHIVDFMLYQRGPGLHEWAQCRLLLLLLVIQDVKAVTSRAFNKTWFKYNESWERLFSSRHLCRRQKISVQNQESLGQDQNVAMICRLVFTPRARGVCIRIRADYADAQPQLLVAANSHAMTVRLSQLSLFEDTPDKRFHSVFLPAAARRLYPLSLLRAGPG